MIRQVGMWWIFLSCLGLSVSGFVAAMVSLLLTDDPMHVFYAYCAGAAVFGDLSIDLFRDVRRSA